MEDGLNNDKSNSNE